MVAFTPTEKTTHNSHKFGFTLSPNNYGYWKAMVQPFLVTNNLFGYVDGTIPCPPVTIPASSSSEKESAATTNPSYTAWVSNDAHVRMLITSTISEASFQHVQGLTSRDLWLSLERAYDPHTSSREYTLKTQLLKLEMKLDETSSAYLTRAQEYANALANIGDIKHGCQGQILINPQQFWGLNMAPLKISPAADPQCSYDTTRNKLVSFYGHQILTTVTNNPKYVTSWISETNRQINRNLPPVIGLDVEWTPPSLTAGRENPVAIIQLCFRRRCLIFQIIHAADYNVIPGSLIDFLNNPNYTFAGVGIQAHVERLMRHHGIGVAANVADLGRLAAEVYGDESMRRSGLKTLTMVVFGKKVEKPQDVTLSRWHNRWLSPEQVDYASIDAFLSFEIARVVDHDKFVSFYEHQICTTITKDPNIVTSWIYETDRQIDQGQRLHRLPPVIGLDVEWTPPFLTGGHGGENAVAIIQLCFSDQCLIFQILQADYIPDSLIDFLNNPNYTFAGVGIQADVDKLMRHYGIEVEANVADLGWLAAEVYGNESMRRSGLKALTMVVLRKEVEKPQNVTLSRWHSRWLSPEQVEYASIDAFLSFEIARVLISMGGRV
ncbi:hypothetical protein OSB04_023481 [Centaurea solstitialis]|uniref:3'-5' exonuclease domain-containing protein n=1 Tax=Centaurea solstitialis TaxID=347529 RepID=A0AA38SKX2_9ASTR|nr:hypothetical protein OSB04_023481 [Centaurea solstitialis]